VSFVVYDVETTGLTKGFDQIVEFAAVRTDADLEITDQFEARCQLLPHVIPSPGAMHVTGLRIEDLTDPALPSHFEMMTRVHRVLGGWCPSLFLGFNSIAFDEEFLRQAFYQCLLNPYLTNTQGSARADVLNLCRVTAALRPDVLAPAQNGEGRPVFKLAQLAEANNIAVPAAHEAMSDVTTTLALCRHIRAGAPEIWSQFLRFSQRGSVEAFITGEDAFLFSETRGNDHRARIVTRIGQNTERAIRHYCLDLGADMPSLRAMEVDDLTALFRSRERPIVTVRTNAAPTLWALCDATPEHLAPFDEAEVLALVETIRADEAFVARLRAAAQAAEPTYPPSPHVEQQLYGRPFPPNEDEGRMERFHRRGWDERPAIVREFEDDRCYRLARRLIYFERPDLLSDRARNALRVEIGRRLMAAPDDEVRWRSIPKALRELEALKQEDLSGAQRSATRELEAYLIARHDELIPVPIEG
jgi:exodeoxyribonuclease-1